MLWKKIVPPVVLVLVVIGCIYLSFSEPVLKKLQSFGTSGENLASQYDIEDDMVMLNMDRIGLRVGIWREAVEKMIVQPYIRPFGTPENGKIEPENNYSLLYFPTELLEQMNKVSNEEMTQMAEAMICKVFNVNLYNEEAFDMLVAEGMSLAEITDMEDCEVIGRQEGKVYVFGIVKNDLSELNAKSVKEYNGLINKIPEMKKKFALIPFERPPLTEKSMLPTFSATTLTGEPVNNSLFAGHNVTMINFWGTYCGPCIDEMPDLGELAREMPEGTQLVGVIIDAEGNTETAKDILTKANALENFVHIIPDDSLMIFLNNVTAVPTTIFVDSEGQQIGESIVGAKKKEVYVKELESRIK